MSQYIFKMPDLGEGTVEAEVVHWHIKAGDRVKEDQVIVEVMTDKAAVEVPSPVTGLVLSIHGAPGDKIAVGSALIVFETGDGNSSDAVVATTAAPPVMMSASVAKVDDPAALRVMASPATRRRAQEAGIDLAAVNGTGAGGRILRADLAVPVPQVAGPLAAQTTEIKVIGVRRLIAERMSESKRNIPHFAYVEEVDVTELESLRRHLNDKLDSASALTYLPLVVMALTRVLESFPQCNAVYDAARGVIVRHRAVHVGIATQTPDGLKVPVVHNADSLDLWALSAKIRAVSTAARVNQATRSDLLGSTITVTSLGKLGGIASTPVINAPEVAIVGLNKAVDRPIVYQGSVMVRRMMNLSSSFDHRFVDGYDAAGMIQALKDMLEHPATIFISKRKS